MGLQLTGKTVIVTVGSAGMGLAIAHSFYREGSKVIIARGSVNDKKHVPPKD